MPAEAIFHADTRLGEPCSDRIEVAAATAKGVGSKSTLAQRATQNQTGRSAVDKSSGGVFRICIGANTEIPGNEVIDSRSGAKSDICRVLSLEGCSLVNCPSEALPNRPGTTRRPCNSRPSIMQILVVTSRGFRSPD